MFMVFHVCKRLHNLKGQVLLLSDSSGGFFRFSLIIMNLLGVGSTVMEMLLYSSSAQPVGLHPFWGLSDSFTGVG